MWTRNSSLLKSTLILAASVCLFSGPSVAAQKGDLKNADLYTIQIQP